VQLSDHIQAISHWQEQLLNIASVHYEIVESLDGFGILAFDFLLQHLAVKEHIIR
jgi:hypothetical protein